MKKKKAIQLNTIDRRLNSSMKRLSNYETKD